MLNKKLKLLTGSVITRYMKCGKKVCACQTDEKALHGPYIYWTRKVNGKTVGRVISEEQADLVRQYIENTRDLETEIQKVREETEKQLFDE